MPPLSGVRVLDLSRLLPGPFCSLVLAELGAEVIKVEDPGAGDYLRLMPPHRGGIGGAFAALNRGKRSLGVDLKRPAGRDLLLRLLPRTQVVLESFCPGAPWSPDRLRASVPRSPCGQRLTVSVRHHRPIGSCWHGPLLSNDRLPDRP
jgi:crotonobetainyl-CoA:carnitine CoA-transferase CaiB-like acyl-CoA transferase